MVTNEAKAQLSSLCQFLSFISELNDSIQQSTFDIYIYIYIYMPRRFLSIFRIEYEVGNWPSTGSMSLVRIQKSRSYYRILYVRRLVLPQSETTVD